MIEQELLLLGLLKEGAKHGYEIKVKIAEILSLFAGVTLKSIYYPLRILEKKGLVTKRAAKPGKRPQRFVYALTKEGAARFNQLLTKSFLEFKRPEFSLDLSLYFLKFISSGSARRRLRGRIFILNKVSKGLKEMLSKTRKKELSLSLEHILEHNLKLLEAESQFLINLTKKI